MGLPDLIVGVRVGCLLKLYGVESYYEIKVFYDFKANKAEGGGCLEVD